eukprot:1945418-Alexandrium_andersonii.AAC.1
MSASLVGSEMCIRDSHRTLLGEHPHNGGDAAGARLVAPVLVIVAGQRAVSYTHLTLPTICSV